MPIELSALTFNAFHDYPRCRHLERRLRLLEDGIVHEAPDVVILQEVSASLLYGHLTERLVAALRGRGLRYDFFYAPANGSLARGEAFEEGSAILSRWPIRDAEARRLAPGTPVERDYHGYRYVEYRIAIAASVKTEGGILPVVGAHVTDTEVGEPRTRRLQIEDLERFVAERSAMTTLPAIVGGDLNALPDSPDLEPLRRAGLRDVCDASGPVWTNDPDDRDLEDPRETARQRIDYLFVSRGEAEVRGVRLFLASPVEIEPGRHLWASDHNGILAELTLQEK